MDAAHILPWASFDLDSIRNGLCLCKIHHWAFDEGIVRLRYVDPGYDAVIDEAVATSISGESPIFSLDLLRAHAGPVSVARLPTSAAHWPHPEFLKALDAMP